MATTIDIRIRGDTAANWESKNPILKQRELGYDMTAKRLKVGEGLTAWKDLAYVAPDVIDDLVTGGIDKALSAEQGKELKKLIDTLDEKVDDINKDPGQAATITIGSVTTGAAGSNAIVTNSGTSSAAILNFTIPQGVAGTRGTKGDKGDKGDTGPQGPKGESGATISVINNLTNTSTTAALSAYQGKVLNDKIKNYSIESWTFTLTSGSTVTKKVVVSS